MLGCKLMPISVAEYVEDQMNPAQVSDNAASRTNMSTTVEVDLAAAHANMPLGLSAIGETLKWLTIERCDGALNYWLRQTDGGLSGIFRAGRARNTEQHEFIDIVVSNPITVAGICRFIVGWWRN